MKKLIMSFVYAFLGLWYCLKSERNFRIHTFAAITVLGILPRYNLTSTQIAIIFMVIGFVLVCEIFNTAIESLANSVTTEVNPLIKTCKDVAAGGVYVSTLCAVGIAWQILWNTKVLGDLIKACFSAPINLTIFVLYILVGILFVFLPERKKK
ncbi:MAG: diacylglycerol kinase family protein [Eubacteriales bacterium]|nr:diacylglycerol kinase family protein [Eubacteriales bacterium]